MSTGRDTHTILKFFKQACISYAPSDVAYRSHTVSRASLIGMRRELLDRVIKVMEDSELFKKGATFPRRYFDDMVLE